MHFLFNFRLGTQNVHLSEIFLIMILIVSVNTLHLCNLFLACKPRDSPSFPSPPLLSIWEIFHSSFLLSLRLYFFLMMREIWENPTFFRPAQEKQLAFYPLVLCSTCPAVTDGFFVKQTIIFHRVGWVGAKDA